MRIGEWNNIGRVRGLVQRQLGELKATEHASHVTINPDNGRMRVLVATDVGLLDYSYGPIGTDPAGPWILRGSLARWSSVRGLRLQSDAQQSEQTGETRSVWHMVAEEPKFELGAGTESPGERPVDALLDFARACLSNAR